LKHPLGSVSDLTFSMLRIVAGYLFAIHGAQKLFGTLGMSSPVELTSRLGAAGVIEIVGGTLIAIGLYTSIVAFICSGEMAFAYFLQHAPTGPALVPQMNGGELAVLYCFLFLFMASRDSGTLSVDRLVRGRR
jgi:putative oxidoreductase